MYLLGIPLHKSLKLEVICINEALYAWSLYIHTYICSYMYISPACEGKRLAGNAAVQAHGNLRPWHSPRGTGGGKKTTQKPNLPALHTYYYKGELLSLHLSQGKKKTKSLGFLFVYLQVVFLCCLLYRFSAPTCIHCDSLLVSRDDNTAGFPTSKL